MTIGAALAASMTLLSLLAAPVSAANGTMPGSALVELIAAGKPVELDGATITGDVDLRPVDTVARVVRCTNCTFAGSILASNTIFNRVVDLSGATIAGAALFDGAVFRDAFLMRETTARPAAIDGLASFTLAAFNGRASFEGIRFASDADFRVAQFLADASFADAEVDGAGRFDGALFDGRAWFSGSPAGDVAPSGPVTQSGCPGTVRGVFVGPTSFTSVAFSDKVDFRQRCFGADAAFDGATFGAVDFSLAIFRDRATFDDASVDGAASFRVVQVFGDLSFQHVVLRGPATFEAAILHGKVQLAGTSASDSLSLDGVKVGSTLGLNKVQANGFEMDLDKLGSVPGGPVREAVLAMVESSARARGDLGLANEAEFQRSSLETDRAEGLDRTSGLLQREVAGYFVKPIYPLRAFAILFVVGMFVRFLVRTGALRRIGDVQLARPTLATLPARPSVSRQAAMSASRSGLLSGSQVILDFAVSAESTFRAAFGLKLTSDGEPPDELSEYGVAIARGAEWLTYKVLIAMFLLGLANSNPTFKQLFEAVAG